MPPIFIAFNSSGLDLPCILRYNKRFTRPKMIIDIKTLRQGVSHYQINETAEKLGIDIEDVKFTAPVLSTVEISNVTGQLTVSGSIKSGFETNCARCGCISKGNIDSTFEHKYVNGEAFPGGELNKDALDEEILSRDTLDFFDEIRQAVLLAVPEKVVCRENCKGICPGCNKNLNKDKCSCKPGVIKPFAELKNLLKDTKAKKGKM